MIARINYHYYPRIYVCLFESHDFLETSAYISSKSIENSIFFIELYRAF